MLEVVWLTHFFSPIEFSSLSPYNVLTGTAMPSKSKGDKNLQIQNENDLLGLLIQNATNDFMNQYDLLQLSGLDHQTYNYYVKSLKSGSLVDTDLANIYLTDLGKNSYVSKQDKIKKSFFDFSKLSLKFTFESFLEIAVALLTAFLIWYFGWN